MGPMEKFVRESMGLAIGVAFLATLAWAALSLRQQAKVPTPQETARQAVEHVLYVEDHGVCFAFTWVAAGDSKAYLWSWVPCTERLPVANTPASSTGVPL